MSPRQFLKNQWHLPIKNVRSLIWEGDVLVDWASGGTRMALNGEFEQGELVLEHEYDRAVQSPSGDFVVVYQTLGQQGLLLHHGQPIRALERAEYCCSTYECPMTFIVLSDGSEALVYCPEEYCDLVVEDAKTGERLPMTEDGVDLFWSRLTMCPNQKWLGHAGWVWHPWDAAGAWRIEDIERDPNILRDHPGADLSLEMASSMLFLGNDRALVSHSDDYYDEDSLEARYLSIVNLESGEVEHTTPSQIPVGTMLGVGANHIIGLYKHPSLIDYRTGECLHTWHQYDSGEQCSSIIHHISAAPPLAVHPKRDIFALAQDDGVVVMHLATYLFS